LTLLKNYEVFPWLPTVEDHHQVIISVEIEIAEYLPFYAEEA
jgi:hypothetical protein